MVEVAPASIACLKAASTSSAYMKIETVMPPSSFGDLAYGHRALSHDGRISSGFRWYDPADERDPEKVLEDEGVKFSDGRADPAQHVAASELAALVGLGEDVDVLGVEHVAQTAPELGERHARFLAQLAERDRPAASGAIVRLVDQWVASGGRLTFGSSATTSAFPTRRGGRVDLASRNLPRHYC